jgi:8-oxo-dGTP diphosphatase
MKHLEVVAGIIIYDDKILCMQRNVGKYDYISYKYEFPGGKIEEGESKAEALMRELREEMELEVSISDKDFFMTVTHEYPDFLITMHSFICKTDTMEFVRKEHINHQWLKVNELGNLDWAAADKPIVEKILNGPLKI